MEAYAIFFMTDQAYSSPVFVLLSVYLSVNNASNLLKHASNVVKHRLL